MPKRKESHCGRYRMKNQVTIVIALIVALTFPAIAPASGTDPSGAALRAYVEQYLKTASPTNALASKINAAGGVNAWGVNEWLCSLEITATLSVGYRIWETRMRADSYYLEHFSKSQFIPLNITNYCITYSNNCDHWNWSPDCLKGKLGK